MADSDDEFDSMLREVGADATESSDGKEDDFDKVLGEVGLQNDVPPSAPARAPGTGNTLLDALIGLGEGATLNHSAELGSAGSWMGTKTADLLLPSLTRDGQAPEYAGRRGVDPAELVDRSQETAAGNAAKLAGLVATSAALPNVVGGARALGGGLQAARAATAVAPTLATTTAAGAASGALAAGGETGHDPLAMLAGGATGGALAGLGGAAAERLGGSATLGGVPTTGTRADALMRELSAGAQKLGGQAGIGAGIGAITSGSTNPVDVLKGAGKGALTAAALGKLGGLAPKAAPLLAPATRRLGSAAAPFGGMLAGRTGKARAQDADVAYGTAPTMGWAVQSVLTAGDTGLDPADEQRLTEAVLSGDDDKLISANFALQQRSPAYAARLRRELESLQEED